MNMNGRPLAIDASENLFVANWGGGSGTVTFQIFPDKKG